MKQLLKVAIGAAALGLLASAASAATLDDVKARGTLKCVVNTGLAGFAAPNDKGEFSGFDIDFCKAVAAAVFGDATKVEVRATASAKDRFRAALASPAEATC
jgi:general L-amino acid transport system substrate-binding protein